MLGANWAKIHISRTKITVRDWLRCLCSVLCIYGSFLTCSQKLTGASLSMSHRNFAKFSKLFKVIGNYIIGPLHLGIVPDLEQSRYLPDPFVASGSEFWKTLVWIRVAGRRFAFPLARTQSRLSICCL